MEVLNHRQIEQKTTRLAFQIAEQNHQESTIHLVGINNNGYAFAQLIQSHFPEEFKNKLRISRVHLNPADPLNSPISLDKDLENFIDQSIIIVDDVCNSGRTLFYGIKPFLSIIPKRIQVAVLLDRKHKSYPIEVNYVGLSLATTLQENIKVNLSGTMNAILQ